MVNDFLSKNNFVEADRYASYLKDDPEYAKLFHRSPGKKELMSRGIPGMMDIPAAREVLCEFLPLVPQMAKELQGCIDLCDQVMLAYM